MMEALLQQLSNSSHDRGDREFDEFVKEIDPSHVLAEVPPEMRRPVLRDRETLSKNKTQILVAPKPTKLVPKESTSLRVPKQGTKSALGLNNVKYMNLIEEAISNLKDRNGASLPKIKAYLTDTYGLNMTYTATYIKSTIKKGMERGIFKNGRSKLRFKLTKGPDRTSSAVPTSSNARNSSTVRAGGIIKPEKARTSKNKGPKVLSVLNRRGRITKKKTSISQRRMTNVPKGVSSGTSNRTSSQILGNPKAE